jgi:SET domain-containing protein
MARKHAGKNAGRAKAYRVGRSRTGLGLFATAVIAAGSFIVEYKGSRIPHAEAVRREARGSRYVFEIDSRWSIDGSSRRNIARYANHSCRPNAESDLVAGKLILRAIERIDPGTEITYHYGREYFDLFIKPIGCKCPRCTRKRAMPSRTRRRSA